MKKLRIGIVGCGGIANQKHLPSLKANADKCEIVAFCDIIEERAIKACQEYGAPGAKVYTDHQEMLKDADIDVVHVLTPNVAHCEITVHAFEAGKHVMCEKPMAANTADAQKMIDAWKKSGKKFTIGYQNRFRPEVQNLKKACEAGDLGEIYYAKAHAIRRRGVPTWGVFPNKDLQGGGPLIDIGTHSLDLTLWMMNNYKPKTVMGASFQKLGRVLQPGNQGNTMGVWDPETYQVEDSAFGFVTMENGAVIVVEASWALNTLDVSEALTELCGTKAGADMKDGLRINTVCYDKLTTIKPDCRTPKGVAFFDGASALPPEVYECKRFYDAVEGKGEPVVKPEEAFVVTQILDAIYRSAETGKLIEL